MKQALFIFLLAAALTSSTAWAGTASLYGSHWDTDELDDTLGGGIALGLPLGNSLLDVDLRAAYQEELTDEPVEALFEDDDPIFEPDTIRVVPAEVGLKVNFNREGVANPYVGGGASYFFIDPQRPGIEIDDELGFYGLVGSRFGDDDGAAFFVEATYRQAEATAIRGDVGEIEDRVDLDLGGFGGNVGVVWRW
jgi:hypothetical protein